MTRSQGTRKGPHDRSKSSAKTLLHSAQAQERTDWTAQRKDGIQVMVRFHAPHPGNAPQNTKNACQDLVQHAYDMTTAGNGQFPRILHLRIESFRLDQGHMPLSQSNDCGQPDTRGVAPPRRRQFGSEAKAPSCNS